MSSISPPPTSPEGIVPGWYYVVRKKGVVELGFGACAECHTRVMPNGSLVKGAQSNAPMAQSKLWRQTHRSTPEPDPAFRQRASSREYAPWAPNQDNWDEIGQTELIRRWGAMPSGVLDREGASTKHPVRVPSLIGVGDIKYLDATGLTRHRGAEDMMRYVIVNQGLISSARYGDFASKTPPQGGDTRYSDEQLYALTLFLYSLKAPPNPNPLNQEAKRGQLVFSSQACAGCHPAPLYTNNALTPVRGFVVPDLLRKTDKILDVSVGTDPGLALETRRGTGFYKVPSLRGVWMRTALGHAGQALGLEEWFDPRRLNADYVPKGFHLTTGPIRGHEFGLKISSVDREALIAFLNTL